MSFSSVIVNSGSRRKDHNDPPLHCALAEERQELLPVYVHRLRATAVRRIAAEGLEARHLVEAGEGHALTISQDRH